MLRREPVRRERAERTARQIVRTARRVFEHKGFHAARISDIASAAGLAQGTIYVRFASKQDLLQQVCALTVGKIGADLQANGTTRGAADDAQQLYARAGDTLVRHARLLRLCVAGDSVDPACRDAIRTACGALFATIEAHIRTRVREERVRPMDPALAARMYLHMLLGQVLLERVVAAPRARAAHITRRDAEMMVSLLETGLVTPQTPLRTVDFDRRSVDNHGTPS